MKLYLKQWLVPCIVSAVVVTFVSPAWSQARNEQAQAQENTNQVQNDRQRNQQDRQNASGEGEPLSAEQTERSDTARKLKVFQLEHSQPRDLQHLLSVHTRHEEAHPSDNTGEGQVTVGYRGTAQERLAIATADDSKLLFVRGSEEEIKGVEQLVEALDVPQEQLKQQSIGRLHVFPVNRDRGQNVNSVLAQLDLEAQLVPWGEMHLIVVSADEQDGSQQATTNLQQVEEVMSRLGQQRGTDEQEDDQRRPENRDRDPEESDSDSEDDSQSSEDNEA